MIQTNKNQQMEIFLLENKLKTNLKLNAQLLLLSRNFGAFSAIRAGLEVANGNYFGVMAADLQEPPELLIESLKVLETENFDVVVGARDSRKDPFLSKVSANTFWYLYKKFIISEMPVGGVDIFCCNHDFRQQLLNLDESHSSLIAQIFWLGFRRKIIYYKRLERKDGVSAWTLKKKINYMMDSIFSFTDLPIRILSKIGLIGMFFFAITGLMTFIAKVLGGIEIAGYTTTFLTIGFFGAMNLFGLGIIGSYTWRTYENTKQRPLSIILTKTFFNNND